MNDGTLCKVGYADFVALQDGLDKALRRRVVHRK